MRDGKASVRANVPETGGPFNMAVTFGNMIYISGLPRSPNLFASDARGARQGRKLPPTATAFEEECKIVMDHMKMLVEAAGSNMDCLLKSRSGSRTRASRRSSTGLSQLFLIGRETAVAYRMQAGRTPRDCGSKSTRSLYPGIKPVSAAGRGR